VIEVSDGSEAIRLVRAERFEVVLTDAMMSDSYAHRMRLPTRKSGYK
jgi:hypothetical protein